MSGSVSFDPAAGYYDRTRSLPDELMRQTVAQLVELLPRDGRCLEVGIGTGRMALPLMREGVELVGADLSRQMLMRLRENAGDAAPPVVQADATRLPFGDAVFASALAAHVLHLIANWGDAVDELMRVVRPGGVLAVSRGARGRIREQGAVEEDPWEQRVTRHFFAQAGDPPWPPGLDSMELLDEHMTRVGASVHRPPEVVSEGTSTIDERLNTLEQGYWAACWLIDDETRKKAAARTRDWAAREIGALDEPRTTFEWSIWRVYRLAE